MDNLKYTFSHVNDWIKNADQKAMILGSFNLAGFIYQLVNIDKISCWSIYTVILFFLSLTATATAMFFWLRVIYPRLDNNHKMSKIFFQHIANTYVKDIDLGIEELQKITDEQFKRDIASQIIINSVIAKEKYVNIQKFIWTFEIQLILTLLLLISFY